MPHSDHVAPLDGAAIAVAGSDELDEGGMMLVEAAAGAHGGDVLLVRIDGTVYAVDAVCTHALGYLDEGERDGYEVECPLHRARFDVRTGAVTQRPATEPLRCYRVIESDGQIQLDGRQT